MRYLAALLLLLATPALAATYYVRTDGYDGCLGTYDAPYASHELDGKCSFAEPQKAILVAVAGDVILIHQGTYARACGATSHGTGNPQGGFDLTGPAHGIATASSGTAGNVITMKGFPGDAKPVLCAVDTTCPVNPACSAIQIYDDIQYWRFEGLHIKGVMRSGNTDNFGTVNNITITGNEFEMGAGCDGNFPMLYITSVGQFQIDHNYFHDLNLGACSNFSSSTSFKTYHDQDTVFEFNTVKRGSGAAYSYDLDVKSCPRDQTIRYNEFLGGSSIRVNSVDQTPCKQVGTAGDISTRQPRNFKMYGNTISGTVQLNACSNPYLEAGRPRAISGFEFRNNTIYHGSYSIKQGTPSDIGCTVNNPTCTGGTNAGHGCVGNAQCPGGACTCGDDGSRGYFSDLVMKDNVWASALGSDSQSIYTVNDCHYEHRSGWAMDYNVYDTVKGWARCFDFAECSAARYPNETPWCSRTRTATLADWRTDFGKDAGSNAKSGGCMLVDPTNGDYHLNDATCSGYTTSNPTTVSDPGAYGITNCVGYLCGAAPPAQCGNGVTDLPGEVCDWGPGSMSANVACSTLGAGYTGGSSACKSDCTGYVTSTCTTCGNGVVETGPPAETCDGPSVLCTMLGLGYTAGSAPCNGTCSGRDVTGCSTATGTASSGLAGATLSGATLR